MCGIAGVFAFGEAGEIREPLEAMTAALSHRGPDGQGFYVEASVGLGHRRLSIIDPDHGQQPMALEDNSVVLIFNGEIYNFKELRAELQQLGHRFRTSSDTEVVLLAYLQWGEACQQRFNGMWAFAIWDARHQKLFLSRDRVGEKPLFYAVVRNNFIFASEPAALFAYGLPRVLDPEQVELYLSLGYVPAPYSLYKNVQKLEAGKFIVAKGQQFRVTRYWELPQIAEEDMRVDSARILEEFDYLLRDSVRLRMRSDVSYGAFLSGGLDSSSIVSLMTEHIDRVKTFTIGFDEVEFDERSLAQSVAQRFSTDHYARVLKPPSFGFALDRTLKIYEEPFGDSSAIPSDSVCGFAAEHVKMVLTGDGGDEVLSGYPAYQSEKFGDFYKKAPAIVRKGLESGVASFSNLVGGDRGARLRKVAQILGAAGQPFKDRLIAKSAWIDSDIFDELIHSQAAARPVQDYFDEVFRNCQFVDPFYRLMFFNFTVSLPERMLTKVDRVSMANSLECRAPFLDPRLVELMAGVSKSVKMPWFQRKFILRQTIGKSLPEDILMAPKKGFSPPLRYWLSEDAVSDYVDYAALERIGLQPEVFSSLVKDNSEGRRDVGHFIWIVLLLLRARIAIAH